MTQVEYDAQMKELNNQKHAELAPLRNEMERIEKEKAFINQQMDQLRMKSRELGSRYYSLCSQAKAIKEHYNERKHDLYVERPCKTEQSTSEVKTESMTEA